MVQACPSVCAKKTWLQILHHPFLLSEVSMGTAFVVVTAFEFFLMLGFKKTR